MVQESTDIALVERVQAGDKNAFNLLVAKYQFKIMHLVSRFIRDNTEQQDITQEVFIKAYRAIDRFRGDSAFYTWLYRIAINTAKNHLVASGRRPPTQDVDVDEVNYTHGSAKLTEIHSPESNLENDQLVSVIKQAIDQLPSELKDAIILRELEGLSYEDIANAMDCPIGTVRSRIFRARESIEAAMAPLLK